MQQVICLQLSCIETYRDCCNPDSLHSGVSEQVPQGRAHLCGCQGVGGARDSGGDVLYGFCSHVMNYRILLQDSNTNTCEPFIFILEREMEYYEC